MEMLKSTWFIIPDLFHGGKIEIKFVYQLLKLTKISIPPKFENSLKIHYYQYN